ncbi:MAG TPA: M48 family metallopeptidase [Thermoleophilaceae bacterium]|jgi:Zn-dependent protease with chaperone function
MSLPVAAHRYEGISPRAFQHPADRAATAALQQIPHLDAVVRKLIELGYERALRQAYLGSAVRLGESQLPHIWVLQREAYNALDMPEVPDLYLTQFPIANAAAIGAGSPIVVLNSELVRLLDSSGQRVVLAHEAAHVLADHVLYQTALVILLRLGAAARLPLLAGLPLMAIRAALLEWSRAAELSCDRAAALVARDPMAVCRTLMTLAAGEAAADLDLDAFMAQGLEYRERGSGLERLSRLLLQLNLTHPLPVRRTHELLEWVRGGDYDRIVGGEYLRRGEEWRVAEEADAASSHYGERIRDAFRDAGQSIADVGQQLGDWLTRTRGGDDEADA